MIPNTDAGRWALQTLSMDWPPLIESALSWRPGDAVGGVAQTTAFIRFTVERGRRMGRR